MALRDQARTAARAGSTPTYPPPDRTVTDAPDPGGRFTADAEPVGDRPASAEDTGIYRNSADPLELEPIDYTNSGLAVTDPGSSVHIAWAAVMAEIQQVTKDGKFQAPGAGTYNFRGIDATVNAVGPALRKHRVMVIPTRIEPQYSTATVGRNQTTMREVRVLVTYRIYGPAGDFMDAVSAGECLDSGDKGTTKACTVAFRNLLLTALAIPTNNPHLDADQVNYVRSQARSDFQDRPAPPMPNAQQLANEAVQQKTTRTRLVQMHHMVNKDHPHIGQAIVTNEVGDEERLLDLITRHGQERPADAPQE